MVIGTAIFYVPDIQKIPSELGVHGSYSIVGVHSSNRGSRTFARFQKCPYETVIFDLDGTLVDSAPGILCSLHAACCMLKVGIPTIVRLDAQPIGPPLQQILRTIVGEQPK